MKICKNKNGFSYLLVCVITLFVAMLIVAGLSYADAMNIIRVQKQFYSYPTEEGDRMIRLEVMGDENADHRKLTPRNSLERGMFAVWDRGGWFHTTGVFLLKEEVPLVGQDPYES